jgi:hypothetical protein
MRRKSSTEKQWVPEGIADHLVSMAFLAEATEIKGLDAFGATLEGTS